MTYFLDFDFTIADTTPLKKGKDWKDAQRYVPEISIYPEAVEFIESSNNNGDSVYIVSGNVGSTIKKVVTHFNIPVKLENIYGYRFGYPMKSLQRKIRVIQEALKNIENKEEVVYIGDTIEDETACKELGIKFQFENFSKMN